jgi:hypothetical protein
MHQSNSMAMRACAAAFRAAPLPLPRPCVLGAARVLRLLRLQLLMMTLRCGSAAGGGLPFVLPPAPGAAA